jgi:hypothetical protein
MSTWQGDSPAPQPSWWSRNWKWVVPVGCLLPLLSCGCLLAVVLGAVGYSLKETGLQEDAVAAARQSTEVRAALGEDVHATGLIPQGEISVQNGRGSASLTVPLAGSRGEGTLRAEALKEGQQWRFTVLQVEVPGQPPIDLLEGLPSGVPPGTVPYPGEPEEHFEPAPEPEEPLEAPQPEGEEIDL